MNAHPRFVAVAAFAVLSILALSCNKERTPAAGGGHATASDLAPDTVVAKIGNESITVAQLDEQAASQLKQIEEKYKKERFTTRKQQLEQLINERLVKAEAAKRGISEEAVFKAEVDDKVTPPPEEEVKKLFDESAARMPPGTTYEQIKPRIVEYLSGSQKQEKARIFLSDLRKKAGVEVKLSEPRIQVAAIGPTRGPDNAKVTVVEFSDFECPYCGRAHDTVEQMMQAYPGKVKLVFRQYPLPMHPHAAKAAEAALCADEQGHFWEYHDLLFKNQTNLEVPQLKEHAKAVGLDATKFDQCLDSAKFASKVKADQDAGNQVGVNGTPAFFINGVNLSGAQPLDEFKKVIDQELGS